MIYVYTQCNYVYSNATVVVKANTKCLIRSSKLDVEYEFMKVVIAIYMHVYGLLMVYEKLFSFTVYHAYIKCG